MDDLKHDILEHRELTTFNTRGDVVRKVRCIYKLGPYGPYTFEADAASYAPLQLTQHMDAKRAELRTLLL